jgi:hypothetical protein
VAVAEQLAQVKRNLLVVLAVAVLVESYSQQVLLVVQLTLVAVAVVAFGIG